MIVLGVGSAAAGLAAWKPDGAPSALSIGERCKQIARAIARASDGQRYHGTEMKRRRDKRGDRAVPRRDETPRAAGRRQAGSEADRDLDRRPTMKKSGMDSVTDRATIHLRDATLQFLKAELPNRAQTTEADAELLVAVGNALAWTLVGMTVTRLDPERSDYDPMCKLIDEALQRYTNDARRFLAAMYGRPVEGRAPDKLISLRRQVGRLYGIVKDMERNAE
jgi:hypothetical protein